MLKRTLAPAACLAAVAALVLGVAVAPGDTASFAPKRITPKGVGAVKLGMTFAELRERGLVGRLRRGCKLGGPNTRSARLRSPLRGTVNFTQTTPRKVTDITVRRGGRARGIRVGSTLVDLREAFPRARVNRSTEEVFGIWLVRIPRNGGGPLRFAVDPDNEKVTLIGIPFIAFCE